MEYYILNPIRLNRLKKLDWFKLWSTKSDYITNYYRKIKGKYHIIDESINYYIVMLELALFYLKEYSYYDYVYIQHSIIIDGQMIIKEDIKERDFSEYIKYLFFKNNYNIKYIYDLIDKYSNRFNYYLVGVRLLYPTYYFFYLDQIIINEKENSELIGIVKRTSEYELFVKNVINKMNEYLTKKIVLPF
ncbi:MAG: hypothetical protein IK137_03605 [Bacilli bacterium]|nr:hypothetical protein [Bacilli bacterium]